MEKPVRTANQGDTNTLVTLMQEFYAEAGYTFESERARAAFEQLIATPSLGQVWIVAESKHALGYIVLTIGYSMEYGGFDAFVEDLYIRPDYRQSGLATKLLEILMAECRNRHVRAVHLEVGRDNQAAKTLYKKFGFEDHDHQLLTRRLEKPLHEIQGSEPQD